MYTSRNIEEAVCQAERTFKAVLITGSRQTGKTTLLRHLFPDREYVNLNDPFLENEARENPAFFLKMHRPPLLIDEVQRVPELFRYLKLECDQRQERGLYVLAGSQQFNRMKNVTESLAGRLCILELPTLSLRELQGESCSRPFLPTEEYVLERKPTAKKPENIWSIIQRGGYPVLYERPDLDWQQYYASLIRTYLERDVRELADVQNLNDFFHFMTCVAARTGQVLNYAEIAAEAGQDSRTVRNWISILETSGIIFLLQPYAPAVKGATRAPKLYFWDTGLASWLARWLTPETLAAGAMAGAMFETYVVSEILKSYANRGIDYRYCVFCYRGSDWKKGSKIDLILEENGVLYPVRIKRSVSASVANSRAFSVPDPVTDRTWGPGAMVKLCPEPGHLRENVLQIPAWYI